MELSLLVPHRMVKVKLKVLEVVKPAGPLLNTYNESMTHDLNCKRLILPHTDHFVELVELLDGHAFNDNS